MINKPIKINDYKSPVESAREELIKESSNPNTKNFSFKGYVPEKERIKEFLDDKRKIESYYEKNFTTISENKSYSKTKIYSNENSFKNKAKTYINNYNKTIDTNTKSNLSNSEKKKKEENLLQPNMRFKHSSDFERIIKAINQYNYVHVEKNLVEERLKKIGENFYKRNGEGEDNYYQETQENYEDYYKFINSKNRIYIMKAIQEKNIDLLVKGNEKILKKKKEMEETYSQNKNRIDTEKENEFKNIYYNKVNSKNKKSVFKSLNREKNKKTYDNSNAKKLISDLHLKTHFQAAAIVANKLKQEELNKNFKQDSSERKNLKSSISNKNFKIINSDRKDFFNNFNNPKNNHFVDSNLNFIYCNTEGNQNFNSTQNNFVNASNKKSDINSNENMRLFNEFFQESPNRKIYSSQLKLRDPTKKQSRNKLNNNDENNENENFFSIKNSESKKNFFKTLSNFMNHSGSNRLIEKFAKKFGLEEANLDMIESNPLIYNLSFNPMKKEANKFNENFGDEEEQLKKLEFLKNLAFKDNSNDKINKRFNKISKTLKSNNAFDISYSDENEFGNENINFNRKQSIKMRKSIIGNSLNKNNKEDKNFFGDEKISIDNVHYNKNHIDKIAKKVLTNCNFIHEKNKNNNTRLMSGNGKMMITSGLTVKEFIQKLNMN